MCKFIILKFVYNFKNLFFKFSNERILKKNTAFFLALLLLTSVLWNVNAQENTYKLTLNECISKAISNNLDVKLSKLNIASQNENIIKRNSVFDPSLNFSLSRREDNVSSSGAPSNSLTASISKKIESGAMLEFQNTLTRTEYNSSTSDRDFSSGVGFQITQPLLKNSGRDVNTVYIKIENNNKDITKLDFKNSVSNIIAEIQNSYWDLVYYRDLFEVKKQLMQLSVNLLEDNKKRVELGSLAPFEIIQAEAGVASQAEDIIISQNNIKNIEDQILQKLNLTNDPAFKNLELLPSDIPEYKPSLPDFDESFKTAVKNRPDYLTLITEIENNKLMLKYYENQDQLSIDLSGSFDLNGYSDNMLKTYSGLDLSDNKWSISASVNIPIGGKSSASDLSKQNIEKAKLLLQLKKLENSLITEIRTKLRNVSAVIQRIEAAKKAVELAKANLTNEQKKFELNQTTSHDLLQFQKELEDSRTKEIKAIIDYRKAVIDYELSTGKILINNNIITE